MGEYADVWLITCEGLHHAAPRSPNTHCRPAHRMPEVPDCEMLEDSQSDLCTHHIFTLTANHFLPGCLTAMLQMQPPCIAQCLRHVFAFMMGGQKGFGLLYSLVLLQDGAAKVCCLHGAHRGAAHSCCPCRCTLARHGSGVAAKRMVIRISLKRLQVRMKVAVQVERCGARRVCVT